MEVWRAVVVGFAGADTERADSQASPCGADALPNSVQVREGFNRSGSVAGGRNS